MSCVLYGPDNRKRTAALLLDLEQIERVIASLAQHDNSATVNADVGDVTLRLTVDEVRSVFADRARKIEHELAILGIKLSALPQPAPDAAAALPSIDREKSKLVDSVAAPVTESVTEVCNES